MRIRYVGASDVIATVIDGRTIVVERGEPIDLGGAADPEAAAAGFLASTAWEAVPPGDMNHGDGADTDPPDTEGVD